MPTRSVISAAIAVTACVAAMLTGCAAEAAPADVVRVPEDAPTISAAVDAVAEGGLILVGAGVYAEQIDLDKSDVTLRGLDRNATVIDAEGVRPYGVVVTADGVTVENLTVTGATYYGVLVTGMHDESGPTARGGDGYAPLDTDEYPPLQRFAIDHVTAYNNGLYGLYAFDAQHGVIRDSYASGSADSGIYVGQCAHCDIQVTGNVAESNAVGFENANASDSVVVAGNRFSGNRVGMTFLSNYQEALAPQRGNTVVGNLVTGNVSADSPAQADGGFGIGIGISGGTANLFLRNRVEDNPRAGILLAGTEDLAALQNSVAEGAFAGNGVDVANVSTDRAPARGNCVEGPVTVLPATLLDACDQQQPAVTTADLPAVDVPPGVSFLRVAAPPPQPDLTDLDAPARVLPATLPALDVDRVPLPDATLLAAWARQ